MTIALLLLLYNIKRMDGICRRKNGCNYSDTSFCFRRYLAINYIY